MYAVSSNKLQMNKLQMITYFSKSNFFEIVKKRPKSLILQMQAAFDLSFNALRILFLVTQIAPVHIYIAADAGDAALGLVLP